MTKNESYFNSILESNPTGIIIVEKDTRQISYVNNAAAKMIGLPKDKIENRVCHEYICPAETCKCPISDLGQTVDRSEKVLVRSDGTKLPILKSVVPIELEGKDCLLESFIDISEGKRAEENLLQSEEKYRSILENIEEAYYETDLDGKYTFFNAAIARTLGFTENELGMSFKEHMDEENIEKVSKIFLQVYATGEAQRGVHWAVRNKNGKTIHLEASVSLRRSSQGNPIGFKGIAQDVTERKKVEDALRESKELYSRLVDSIPDMIVRIDLEGKILFVNDYTLKISGYARDEVEGRNMLMFVAPEDRDYAVENTFLMLEKRLGPRVFHLIMKDGRKIPFEVNGDILRNNDGTPFGIVHVCRDITERKRAEERIVSSEKKFEAAFKSAPDPIAITETSTGKIVDINIPFETWSGYSREELIDRTTVDLNIWVETTQRNFAVDELRAERTVDKLPVKFCLKSGEIRSALYSAKKIEIDGLPYIISHASDVTDHIRAEEEREKLKAQLVQAQKMEAIGTLAGGIAHDFNNILSAILGYSELALDDLSNPRKAEIKINEVLKAADRAKNLVSQILTFSRKTEIKYSPLEVPPLIKESLKMLRSAIPTTIGICQDLIKSGVVMSDPTQIHQLMMNLCTNAAHAMDATGGVLSVSLKQVDVDTDIARDLEVSPGPYLKLSVSDTGYGMTPEIMERIFEPYFTTKELGRGTGLGLSVVHGIVKSQHGAVTCKSAPGKGTIFDIYLPEVVLEKETVTPRRKDPLPSGTERILFIDDEPDLANMAEAMLSRLGYKVVAKTNSLEALELFRSSPDTYDLVISDMTMPGITGDLLAERLMEIRPDVAVILSTGYSEHISEERAKRIGIRELVLKPFDMRGLAETIRKVLDIQESE